MTKVERMVIDFSQGMGIIVLEPPATNLVVRQIMTSLCILSTSADNRDQFSHDAWSLQGRISWVDPGSHNAMTRHVSGKKEKSCSSWLCPPGGKDCLSAVTIAASSLYWGL